MTPVPLVELSPRWWQDGSDREKQGISFLCPCCRRQLLAIPFENPIDGGPKSVGRSRYWHRAGTTFEDLTIRPSIDVSRIGHWHGFVTSGLVTS